MNSEGTQLLADNNKSDDPRLGSIMEAGIHGNVVLIGFPFDEGCRRNGGRPGAKEAPAVFRKFLQKMGPVRNAMNGIDLSRVGFKISDAGDIIITTDGGNQDLEQAHVALEARVLEVLTKGGPTGDGRNVIPFVIGGSNDQSAPNGRALLTFLQGNIQECVASSSPFIDNLLIVNVDAHLDVRPKVPWTPSITEKEASAESVADLSPLPPPRLVAHSGSPFRDLLEDPRLLLRQSQSSERQQQKEKEGEQKEEGRGSGSGVCSPPRPILLEFAAQSEQCSRAHAQYVLEGGKGKIIWMDDLRRRAEGTSSLAPSSSPVAAQLQEELQRHVDEGRINAGTGGGGASSIFLSFDIDSVTSRDCPGVSCPANYGLTAEEAMQIGFVAGQNPSVKLFDLSELNPVVEGYVSPRLAVLVFYWFVMGVCSRKEV